jgi:hypothetical protein
MTLQEIFEQLQYGELSQLRIGTADNGALREEDYPAIVAHLHLGLTSLYRRFALKRASLTVPLVSGTGRYVLAAPDLLKVDRVTTLAGYPLALNDGGDPFSVMTPTLSTLEVPAALEDASPLLPAPLKTTALVVTYRADHPRLKLVGGTIVPAKAVLELPPAHLEALLYFIAARVHNPIGMTNEFHSGNNYYAKYLALCLELEAQGLQVDQASQVDRLSRNGWV